jgi:sugar-specific transcriptional regulator TrmB
VSREHQQRDKDGHESDLEEPTPERRSSTADEVSERAEDFLNDIDDLLEDADRALLEALEAREGQKITDPEIVQQIKKTMDDFVQKGGQ